MPCSMQWIQLDDRLTPTIAYGTPAPVQGCSKLSRLRELRSL
jgi:hypothetical protein